MTQAELTKTLEATETISITADTLEGIVTMLDTLFMENIIVNEQGAIEKHNADKIADFIKVIRTACKGMATQLTHIVEEADKIELFTTGKEN